LHSGKSLRKLVAIPFHQITAGVIAYCHDSVVGMPVAEHQSLDGHTINYVLVCRGSVGMPVYEIMRAVASRSLTVLARKSACQSALRTMRR